MQQPRREKLGEVTAPSGRLLLLDVGQLAFAAEIQPPAVEIEGLPRQQRLFVLGEQASGGDATAPHTWRHVDLEVQPGEPVSRVEELAAVVVDYGQLMLIDEQALPVWVHDEPLDGKADIAFWGDDVADLAATLEAAPLPDEGGDVFGWRDLPAAEARQRAAEADSAIQAGSLRVELDLRPHSHHHQVLEQMRRSPTASATLELAGATLCVFHTLVGEGVFTVERQLDRAGRLVRARIVLSADQ